MREKRADRSVMLFDRGMDALERSSSIRYVFGSYDPYRALPGVRAARGGETDRSYLPSSDLRVVGSAEDDGYSSEDDDDFPAHEHEGNGDEASDAETAALWEEAVRRRKDRAAARRHRAALRRRRQIFFSLCGAVVASLVAALLLRSVVLWGLHAASVLFLAGYMSLLVRHQYRMVERATKVRRITPDEHKAPAERPAVVVLSSRAAR